MADSGQRAVRELYDGYNALADPILNPEAQVGEDSYEMGYLDGWADAMEHAGWVVDGKPVKPRKAFGLFKSALRKPARKAMRRERSKR